MRLQFYNAAVWTEDMLPAIENQRILNEKGEDLMGFDVALKWGKEGNLSTGLIQLPSDWEDKLTKAGAVKLSEDIRYHIQNETELHYYYREFALSNNEAFVVIYVDRPGCNGNEIICKPEAREFLESIEF
jgi:hypothetical protein